MITDLSLAGACEKAYSRPVTDAKISEKEKKKKIVTKISIHPHKGEEEKRPKENCCKLTRNGDDGIRRDLPPDADFVLVVVGHVVVRWRSVDKVLQHCDVDEPDGANGKANGDAPDGTQHNSSLLQERVHEVIEEGDEDDEEEWIHEIELVRRQPSGSRHGDSLRNKVLIRKSTREKSIKGS
jgi:hypothetical protein